MLQSWMNELAEIITREHIFAAIRACIILAIGFFIARRVRSGISRMRNVELQKRLFIEKVAFYSLTIMTVTAALDALGFDLKVLLGAAGILSVAIGFASQTSMSNLISGIFLMIDRPFVIGNSVRVGDVQGEVVAVDLLSTKIRTLENLMVRIPNETLVKSNIVNLSYFPIRRLQFEVGVNYASDLSLVERVLREVVDSYPLTLSNPPPVVSMKAFGSSS
ncbi:MAG: mechanosensitive ion channel family protein, partial [Bdellovibrionales bacterium]|nr:mechanosensitive ion channel family protein [Bdellovibrionales bacterium]